ncbi:MAG: Uncharacterised protein [Rhodospirillaceae bacterium]|jgi:uncharacterized protein YqeY|nr:GatB/YqeY domain-containing protein [Alphaproteobacteria bacterium]CAI8279462.1 MAG: Uncharacterised protein [Rhodospirillaceae bacterium]
MRERIAQAMKDALKSKDQAALSTIRLISAALKDRDIAARSDNNHDGISDDEILSMLQTMIKQRNESAKMYEDGGRPELAAAEQAEIELIKQFLPEQLSHDDIEKAIKDAVAETGAASIKDMGKVMAHLKEHYAGQMDFSAASQMVKAALMG